MTTHFCAFVFCTWLFTKKHVHFTTPVHVSFSDTVDIINQILFKFL